MTKNDHRVVVLTAQGAYIGGRFWSSSPAGDIYLLKDEICLNVDLATNPDEWERIKQERWRGKGEIVEDPRGERPIPKWWQP